MTHLPRIVSVFSVAVLLLWGAMPASATNPNNPESVYYWATENAGRSPLPQPGESFPRPLSIAHPEPVKVAVAPPAGEAVAWTEAHKYVGAGPITVEGTIVNTYQIRDVLCRLNFDTNWRGKFYIAVFNEVHAQLPEPAAKYYMGKTIRVTGLVTTHRDQPNIEVKDISQIEVVDK